MFRVGFQGDKLKFCRKRLFPFFRLY